MPIMIGRPADFYDRNGVAIEIGMRAFAMSWAMGLPAGGSYGDVCRIDESSDQPIGIVDDLDSWDGSMSSLRWFPPDDIECLC